jgi:hypothetical protein
MLCGVAPLNFRSGDGPLAADNEAYAGVLGPVGILAEGRFAKIV